MSVEASAVRQRGAAERSSTGQIVLAGVIGLIVLAVGPVATKPALQDSAPLAAAVFTVIIFAELLTAFLLLQRYLAESDPRLLALAGTYLLTGLLFLARQLVSPGVFVDGNVIAAPMWIGMWLWIIAHAVFPLGIAGAMILRPRQAGEEQSQRSARRWRVALVTAGTSALVVAVTAALIRFAGALPPIIAEGPPALIANLVTMPFAVSLAYWRSRRGGSFERWLLVALVASTADVVLTTLGGRPFTVGWMAGRALSVAAASVLLVTMVGEISQLYRNLAGVHERLKFQAAHDVLTGALARRALIDRIELLVAAANHHGDSGVLAIVDLDRLKQINDRHGHLVGDRVLAEVAQRMRSGLRDGDDLGRYGGDEFVLVMPGASLQHGWAVASRVLDLIRSAPVDTGAGLLWVTATMGIAGVAAGAASVDEVLTRADAALYQAKARGRDRVFADRVNVVDLDAPVTPSPRRNTPMTAGRGASIGAARERGRHRERGQTHAPFQGRVTLPREESSRHAR